MASGFAKPDLKRKVGDPKLKVNFSDSISQTTGSIAIPFTPSYHVFENRVMIILKIY
jgi:hypothetical protein